MKAYLDAFDRITVIAEKYYYNGDTGGFYVRINEHAVPCSLVGRTECPDGVEYALAIDSPFSLEDRLMVADRYGAKCPVQPRFIVKTDWFEEYCTTDTQLGALYEPEGRNSVSGHLRRAVHWWSSIRVIRYPTMQ